MVEKNTIKKQDIQNLALTYLIDKSDRNFTKLIEAIDGPLYVFLGEYITGYENKRTAMAHTYETIWTKFDTYDTKYKFITWAFFIARNIALNIKRDEKNKAKLFDSDNNEPSGGDFSELLPSQAELREQFIDAVIEAIKMLPEPYRTAMYLKDIKNLNFSDISELLNDNNSTIRWRLFKARKEVCEYLLAKYPFIIECLREKQI